jgi:hypothetical protein
MPDRVAAYSRLIAECAAPVILSVERVSVAACIPTVPFSVAGAAAAAMRLAGGRLRWDDRREIQREGGALLFAALSGAKGRTDAVLDDPDSRAETNPAGMAGLMAEPFPSSSSMRRRASR